MLTSEEASRQFAALAGEYHERKAAASKRVRTWQWATAPWRDIRPLYFERHNDLPGRLLRQAPKRLRGRVEAGLDADGRLAVQRDHAEFGYYESFCRWNAAASEIARYHFDAHAPINKLVLTGCLERPDSSDLIADQGWMHEEYVWAGSRIVEVRVSHAPRVAGHYLTLQTLHTAIPRYSSTRLERVELHWLPLSPTRPEPVVEIAYQRADV